MLKIRIIRLQTHEKLVIVQSITCIVLQRENYLCSYMADRKSEVLDLDLNLDWCLVDMSPVGTLF